MTCHFLKSVFLRKNYFEVTKIVSKDNEIMYVDFEGEFPFWDASRGKGGLSFRTDRV